MTAFPEPELRELQRLLHDTAGLAFDAARRDSLTHTLSVRLAAAGCPDLLSYLALLAAPAGAVELQQLVEAVTVQETHFFRNPPQIRALRQHVLPELVRRATAAGRPLTIWSAGCATGEEPYTVAMLVRELMPAATSAQVRIMATDVSAGALEVARRGRYGARAIQMADSTDLDRWFTPEGNSFVVREDVRALVEFRRHNLAGDQSPFAPGSLDLLLCRNVTIYFSRSTTHALMSRFHAALAEGGYLFLGHSETLWQVNDAFTLVPLGDAFVYRRDSSGQRRQVLPDRRTEQEPTLLTPGERRFSNTDRRERLMGQPGSQRDRLPGVGDRTSAPGGRTAGRPTTTEVGAAAGRSAAGQSIAAARAAMTAGRHAEALSFAAAAIAADPLLAVAHLIAGEALACLGRDDEAMVELRKAAYLDPRSARTHLLLAGALDRLGEPIAAARSYRAAATTFRAAPPEPLPPAFGGRGPSEMVELCIRLAEQAERVAGRRGAAQASPERVDPTSRGVLPARRNARRRSDSPGEREVPPRRDALTERGRDAPPERGGPHERAAGSWPDPQSAPDTRSAPDTPTQPDTPPQPDTQPGPDGQAGHQTPTERKIPPDPERGDQ